MIIEPVGGMESIKSGITAGVPETQGEGSLSFKDMLKNAVDEANETDRQAKQDAIDVAAGRSDDLHTLMIDISKADLALYTLVQVRNRALEAYNEIMKIGV